MHWTQIVTRLTGFSTPIFGASWNPPRSEIEIARRMLNFLEDRRVLYNPGEMQVPEHCIASVLEIRRFVTDLLADLPREEGLPDTLREMRAACRSFLDHAPKREARQNLHPFDEELMKGLEEFRALMGVQIGRIAVMHGLDVDPELATILPPPSRADDA